MTSNTADQETVKSRRVRSTDLANQPTRRLGPITWHPIDEEETQILSSISGITPIPVNTTDLMIDADWFRRFHAWLDMKTGGKANGIVALLSFLIIGGSASVINLLIVLAFDIADRQHTNDLMVQLIYGAIATEVSLIYNFTLNDRFTFRSLVDARRSWLQRCLRFHGPAMVGFTLTQILHGVFLVSFQRAHVPHGNVFSQAVAIAIVTVVNFLMHRFWTYRPRKVAPAV